MLATASPAAAQVGGVPGLPCDPVADPTGCLPGGGLPGGGTGGLPCDPVADPTGCLGGGSGGTPGGGTGGLPCDPVADPTGCLPAGGTGGLPGGLPGGLTGGSGGGAAGGGAGSGSTTGGSGGAQGGALDASGPVIVGPSKAATVRVDSKGRFRLAGVKVSCPSACSLSVSVSTAAGTVRFVKRTYAVPANGTLRLKKLKVAKKGLRALRSMGVARVVASLKASAPGGPSAKRGIGLKLKPARGS